jgi:uncharacterized protein (DUF1778 family)
MRSQPTYKPEKTQRLEARLSRDQKELLQHAADLLGRTLTDFIVNASQEAAKKIIHEQQVIRLTIKDSHDFAQTLLNPPKPNAALKTAAKRYRNFAKDND